MVLGIGTDLVMKGELRPEFLEKDDPFCQATFTPAERQEAAARRDRYRYFRGRFAAKEAVFKTLGLPTDTRLPLNQIEVLGGDRSAPAVRLHADAAEAARRRGIRSILLTRLPLNQIEVLGGDRSAPAVRLHADAAEAARRRGIRSILLTLTHNADHTVAFALAQGGPDSKEEELWQI